MRGLSLHVLRAKVAKFTRGCNPFIKEKVILWFTNGKGLAVSVYK